MNKLFRILALFLLIFEAGNQWIYCQALPSNRPKIGLVLSGGGAKGLAHIGVLKVLEEAGIRPDYIAGTSMGSIVGGLYAIGYSADSLEKIAKSTNWSYFLSDDIPRRAISLEEKEDYDRFVLTIPFGQKGLKIPSGVINGQNIENLLNKLCFPVYNVRDFSNFQIPFICNATDIETGKEVVFKGGYLPDALRASMSIPSIFNPIEIDGKLLVDGGLVNNFPANRLKEMGADIIIGVDVGFQSYDKSQLNSLFRIIEQSLFFYGEETTRQNIKLCQIVITPALGKYNAGSFSAADTIISIGEIAAREVYPKLKALADSIKHLDYSFGPDQVIQARQDSVIINVIQVEGLQKVSGELLAGKLQLKALDKVNISDISKAIDRVYSSQYFTKVSYELGTTEDGGTRLLIRVEENTDGLIRFGLHYDSNYKSAILLNTTFRNLLFEGSKFTISGALGDNPYFKSEFFKNNGWKPGFGIAFQSSRSQTYLFDNSRKISSINFYESKLQLFTQSVFQNSYGLGAGIEFENSLLKPIIDPSSVIADNRYRLINYYSFLQMDSYDNAFYPTRGLKMYGGLKLITSKDMQPVTFFHARFSKAEKLNPHLTLIGHIYAGAIDGDSIPPQYLFLSGGFLETNRNGIMPFAGFDYMELASKNLLSFKLDLQARMWQNIYLIGMVNAGNFTNSFNNLFTTSQIKSGYGLTLGYESFIGPMELSVSRSANRGGFQGFVRIGYWF
ncbi:MAG: patatin-like phospholipase family protein [Bacteroidales bacterium]|nr:patatin-like phospholipase family protein [Bacteroidales bacterium]MCB8999881.1 patatin-like phospholipase family protein [Bacteroidales bacterium]